MKTSRLRLFILCLAVTCIALLVNNPSHAQWSEEDGGVCITEYAGSWKIFPDGYGGVWVIFDRLQDGTVRIQRIDRDGYALFPDQGVQFFADSLEFTADLVGSMPSIDETIIVGVNSWEPDSTWSLYAQRFTLEGERVWDEAIRVSQNDPGVHALQMECVYDFAEDGSGGCWMHYTPAFSRQGYICGVNADGSLKTEDDIDFGFVYGLVIFCPDSSGGIYAITYSNNAGDSRYNQVHADGSLRYESKQIINQWDDAWYVVSDLQGGFIYQQRSLYSVYWYTRVCADGSQPWGEEGYILCSGDNPSNILIMPDTSFVSVGELDMHQARISRIKLDGTPYWDTYEILADSIENTYFTLAPRTCVAYDGNNGVLAFYGWGSDETIPNMEGLCGYRIDSTGTVLWGQYPEQHFVAYNIISTPHLGMSDAVYIEQDSSVVILMRNDYRNAGRQLWLYKMYTNGTLAGVNSVARQPQTSTLPESFEIVSAYPSPFNRSVTVTCRTPEAGLVEFQVFDLLGRTIAKGARRFSAGTNRFIWTPEPGLASGTYFLRFEPVEGSGQTVRLHYVK